MALLGLFSSTVSLASIFDLRLLCRLPLHVYLRAMGTSLLKNTGEMKFSQGTKMAFGFSLPLSLSHLSPR